MSSLTKEYQDFMKWFRENYPELKQYERNFSVPFQIGGGVTVNNGYKLSNEEFEKLTEIARSYYSEGTK